MRDIKLDLLLCGVSKLKVKILIYRTFAPVVKMPTVCGFLGLVAGKKWKVHQMNVHNAFLHEEPYSPMTQIHSL